MAARGIGRAIATRFHEEGGIVIVTDLDDIAGVATAAEIGCRFEKLDVREETDWLRLTGIVPVADVQARLRISAIGQRRGTSGGVGGAALRTFDLVYIMPPNGGPDRSTAVPSYEVYKRAFIDGEVGTAVTVAIVLTAIILVVTIGINRFAERGADFES